MRSPDVIKQHRSLYGALGAETTAAESFYAAGPIALVTALADYLRTAQRAGSLAVRNPTLAADQFFSLFLGLGQIRGLLGLSAPTKRDDEILLKANVELFVRAFAAEKRPRARR